MMPEAAHPPDEDLVLVQELQLRLELARGVAQPAPEAAHELVVEVAVHPADAEVVEEHPLAGDAGQHLDDLVALDEAPQDRRQAAEVEGHPADEHDVAHDPVQLAGEDPDVLGPPRHLDVEELLERHDRRPLHEQGAHVLERVRIADRLVVVGVLAELLHPAMEVAEDRIEVDDLLAVDLEDDPEDAVGRWVLGPDVDEHLAVAEGVELLFPLRPRRIRRDRLEDADLLVEDDPRVVQRRVAVGVRARFGAGGHRSRLTGRSPDARGRPGRPRRAGGPAPCGGRRHRASGRRRRAGRSPCGAGSSCSRAACRSGAGRGCPRT